MFVVVVVVAVLFIRFLFLSSFYLITTQFCFMMNSFAMLDILYLIGSYYTQGHRHTHTPSFQNRNVSVV